MISGMRLSSVLLAILVWTRRSSSAAFQKISSLDRSLRRRDSKNGINRTKTSTATATGSQNSRDERNSANLSIQVSSSRALPLIHVPFSPDKAILVGSSGSFAPWPVSALAGRHDDEDVICLRRCAVNTPYPA